MSRILFPFSRLPSQAWLFAFALAFSPVHAQETDTAAAADTDDAADAAEVDDEGTSELWDTSSSAPWSTTVGIAFNSHYLDSSVNLIAPLFLTPNRDGFGFLDIQASAFDEGNQSYSAGLGYRRYVGALRGILGLNVFYDHTETRYSNGFDGIGFGAEYKGPIFDANFNYTLPGDEMERTGTNAWDAPRAIDNRIVQGRYDRYEAALEGYNGEIGFLVPFPETLDKFGELRLFGGYYSYYGSPFNTGEFEGFSSRLEWRINNIFTIDLSYYDDEELSGGECHFTGGFRASIPLGRTETPLFVRGGGRADDAPDEEGAYSGSGNPVGNGREDIRYRFSEDVYRMSRLQTTVSEAGFGRRTDVDVLTNVWFANNGPDRGNGILAAGATADPLGEATNPSPTIDGARFLANFFGGPDAYVYTQGSATDYDEDVTVDGTGLGTSIHFIGSGKPVPAFGGFSFGEGPRPVLRGGFAANDITNFSVIGYDIEDGLQAPAAGVPNSLGDGIAIEDVFNSVVDDVNIDLLVNVGPGVDGISHLTTGGNTGNLAISWTTITDGSGNGVNVIGEDASTNNVTSTDLWITNSGDDSILHTYSGSAGGTHDFLRTTITGAGGSGVDYDGIAGASGVLNATYDHLYVTGAGEEGFDVSPFGTAAYTLDVSNAMFTNVGQAFANAGAGAGFDDGAGIQLVSADTSSINFTGTNIEVNGTGEHGIEVSNFNGATNVASFTNTEVTGTGQLDIARGDGVSIFTSSTGPTQFTGDRITTNMTANRGLDIDLSDAPAGNIFTFNRFTANNSGDTGIEIESNGAGGPSNGTFNFTDTTVATTTAGDGIDLRAFGVGDFTANFMGTTDISNAAVDGLGASFLDSAADPTTTFADLNITGSGNDGVGLQTQDAAEGTFFFSDLDIDMSTATGFFANTFDTATLTATILGATRNFITNSGEDAVGIQASDMAFADVAISNVEIDGAGFNGISLFTNPAAGAADTERIDFSATNVAIRNVGPVAALTGHGILASVGSAAGNAAIGNFTFSNIDIFSPANDGIDLTEFTGATMTLTSGANNTVNIPGALSLDVTTPNFIGGNLILNGVNLIAPAIVDTP